MPETLFVQPFDVHNQLLVNNVHPPDWPNPQPAGRYTGVSNFNVAQMTRAQAIAPITSLQPRYSLIHREIENEILPFAARHNIGVIAYSPMGSGLLTGDRGRAAARPGPRRGRGGRISAQPAGNRRNRGLVRQGRSLKGGSS